MAPKLTCDCGSCAKCYQRRWRRKVRAAQDAGVAYQPDPKRQELGRRKRQPRSDEDVEARMDEQAAADLPSMRAYQEPRHYSVPTYGGNH